MAPILFGCSVQKQAGIGSSEARGEHCFPVRNQLSCALGVDGASYIESLEEAIRFRAGSVWAFCPDEFPTGAGWVAPPIEISVPEPTIAAF